MSRIRSITDFVRSFFVLICALVTNATAGLSGPPQSYVREMPDGRHMLVFLSPVPPDEDEGKFARVPPDNRLVNLREDFPSSGYYELGSTKPIWTAPWAGKDGWSISVDGRFLVRWNYFGDGEYDTGGDLSWGLKFYDRGKEIKAYDVAELLDYPALMEYTTWDWHYLWTGNSAENLEIRDGQFILQTSTHDYYRFDVATGEITSEFRLWPMLAKVASAVGAVTLFIVSWLVFRRNRRQRGGTADASTPTNNTAEPTARRGDHFFSFGLRTLLIVTTCVAVLCLAVPRWPHVVLLAFTVLCAMRLTRGAIRYRRRNYNVESDGTWRLIGVARRYITAGVTWCFAYILSAGPVIALIDRFADQQDVRMAVMLTIYRPVYWFWIYGPNIGRLLERYYDAWDF